MKKKHLFLFLCLIACLGVLKMTAQKILPNLPMGDDFGGTQIIDLGSFVPSMNDYTLELEGEQGMPITISFAQIEYTPSNSGKIRFVQKEGKVYVFEGGLFKAELIPSPQYSLSETNLIQNPSFEEVKIELTNGRWQPTVWETWNGGMPTWGGDVGKTNVREDAGYRSDGKKSIIMHSDTRELFQLLPKNSLKPDTYYLLAYDYWTSSGSGNGGVTYDIILRKGVYDDIFQTFAGHTTLETGTAKSVFSTLFLTPKELPSDVWFVLKRNESKVDWLDNFKLMELIPLAKGISGTSSAVYLRGKAVAPGNLTFENGDFIDMTERIANHGFDDNTNGWTITAGGSKISTAAKANDLIPGSQNHLQFWIGSGGVNGKICQIINGIPNGTYKVKVTVVASFNGSVCLYVNEGKVDVVSGINKVYEATGVVFDGTVEIGLEMKTTGSPTIDVDDFCLSFLGIDKEGYSQVLQNKKNEVLGIVETINSGDPSLPGYNNLNQHKNVLEYADNLPNQEAETLREAIARLDAAINEYNAILAAYNPLRTAIEQFKVQLSESSYPVKRNLEIAVEEAGKVYASKEDKRGEIEAVIKGLTEKSNILTLYQALKEAIIEAETMLSGTAYPGEAVFREAINVARGVVDKPEGNNFDTVMKELRNAENTYYNSQYTKPSVKQTVSWVDTSLEGSEKFVLRIDNRPFYMTNIQVRLDKLYGYYGWSDAELEAVLKQAANDGFNTVSVPVHWREVEPEKDYFDWRILDKFMGWCKKYNLRMEMLWFSWSSGGRIQYLWNYNGRKEPRTPDYVCSKDGDSEFNILKKTWEYSLDWKDINLRNREKYVLEQIMEHIAVWEANNNNPHTVIGVQLGNEAHETGDNKATAAEIIDYYHDVGAAVKESNHVVWTRLNCVSWMTSGRISANEHKRKNGGTNIDFVGIDIYGTSASGIKGDMGGQLPQSGKNYAMIMEIDAKDSNSPLYQIAAIAGNKAFDYYNMGFVDGNALYIQEPNQNALKEREHIMLVRQRNKILNMANQDVALKKHGSGLYVYNYAGNSVSKEEGIEGLSFTPDQTSTQAIAIRRSETEIVLLSTFKGTFTIPAALNVASVSKGYFNEANEWVKEEELELDRETVVMPETSVVLLKIKNSQSAYTVSLKVPHYGITLLNGLSEGDYQVAEGKEFSVEYAITSSFAKHKLNLYVNGNEITPVKTVNGYKLTIPFVDKDCEIRFVFSLSQTGIPNFDQKNQFGGQAIDNIESFIPGADTFTLQIEGAEANVPVNISYLGIGYTPERNGTIRFVHDSGIIYVYEGNEYKKTLLADPQYLIEDSNLLQNPGFEEVGEQLENSKWKSKIWEVYTESEALAWEAGSSTSIRENAAFCSEGTKSLIMHTNARYLTQLLSGNVLKRGTYYKLTYDYWTSSGDVSGNGGTTYQLYLGSNACKADLLKTMAHTTVTEGTAKNSFEMKFCTPGSLPEECWLTLHRDAGKVDWLDNFNLREINIIASGITGAASATYLAGGMYAPEGIKLSEGNYFDMTSSIRNPSFEFNGLENWTNNGMQSQTNNSPEDIGWSKDGRVYVEKWVDKEKNLPDANISQVLTGLPVGKYKVVALGHVVKQSSNEIAEGGALYAGIYDASVNIPGEYVVETIVTDGTLEIGFRMVNTTGNWAAVDHFRLQYYGEDMQAYFRHLQEKVKQARAVLESPNHPNCFNVEQLNRVIQNAGQVNTEDKEALFDAVRSIDEALKESADIISDYARLKTAIDEFSVLLDKASDYPQAGKERLLGVLGTVTQFYESKESQRDKIDEQIELLTINGYILIRYSILDKDVVQAEKLYSETDYDSKEIFGNAIRLAKDVLENPEHEVRDLVDALNALQNGLTEYLKGRPTEWVTIKNGALWKDDRGRTVQAHGAGFLQVGDTWYMIGEDRDRTWDPNVNMYSSKDLVHWKFERKIIDEDTHPTMKDRFIERPKLLYCKKTGKYVIWCHYEQGNYGASEAAVFYSDSITGPYKYHWSGRPLGIKSRDCNVFIDNDGTAYFISTTNENRDLGLFRLSDDYLSAVEHTKLLAGQGREAPAIVRIDDTYFMLSSACSGWDPNQCKLSYSKSLTSGWSSLTGLNNKWSYDTQAASILTVRGREGVSYLYVGDRWQDPGLAESKTIIFPLEFSGNTCSFKYRQQFDLDFATGKWKDTTPTNRVPKGEWKLREATASQNGHEAAKAFDNNLDTYWHTKWDSPKPVLPYSIEIDMGKEYKVSGFLCAPRLDNDTNGQIRQFMLYISTDGNVWECVAGGSWLPYYAEIYFPSAQARYFRLVSLSGDYASISELDMLTDTDPYTPASIQPKYQINSGEWISSEWIRVALGDRLSFGPNAGAGSWAISGPNNHRAASREYRIPAVTEADAGSYTFYYLNDYNQISTCKYSVAIKGTGVSVDVYEGNTEKKTIEVEKDGTGLSEVLKGNAIAVIEDASSITIPEEQTNVVLKNTDDGNYVCAKLQLADKQPFYTPVDFYAESVVYKRDLSDYTFADGINGWSTLILPFDGDLYLDGNLEFPFSSDDDTEGNYWLKTFSGKIDETTLGFDYSNKIKADTPYIIAFPGDKWGEADSFVGKDISVRATNVSISRSGSGEAFADGYSFRGTYTGVGLSDPYYCLHLKGNLFEKKESGYVDAFRCYLSLGTNTPLVAPRSFGIGGGEITGINGIPQQENDKLHVYVQNDKLIINSPKSTIIRIYGIEGRLVRTLQATEGLNIVTGLANGFYLVEKQKVALFAR